MPASQPCPPPLARLVHACEIALYPMLRQMPPAQRARALRCARAGELDTTERAGIVASVVAAAYLLHAASDGSPGLIAASLVQFLLAWPLLAILAAPWLVRRTRRGLQREADRYHGGEPCPPEQASATAGAQRKSAQLPPASVRRQRL